MATLGDVVYLHAMVDTGTLKELCAASMKLYQSVSHGRIFCWIDSAVAFLQTALFSTVRLVMHVAFAAFSVIGLLSQSGRRFLVENVVRSLVDLTGIVIGLVGTISPWTGQDLTAGEIKLLNRFMKNEFITKDELKGMIYESPIWITRYMYQYTARMQESAIRLWGGVSKIQYKSKA